MKGNRKAALARLGLALIVAAVSLFLAAPNLRAQQAQPTKKTPARKTTQGPGPLETLARQAEEALDKEDFAAAAQALEKFLESRPDDPIAHFQLGYAYTGLKRWDEARAEYSKAVALDPKLAAAYLNLGLILLDRDPRAAVGPLEKAAELMPDQARPQFFLGTAYERAGDAKTAIDHYFAARQKDDKNFEICLALGRVLLASRRAAEAETQFRAALSLRGDSPPAQLGLAEALLAQQKLPEAATQFSAYLQSRPQDQETRYQLATVYADLDRNDEALAELDRAEAAAVTTPAAVKLRAELYLRQKKFSEAARSLEQALALEPQDAALHAKLGRVRLELRDFPAAERELRLALRAKPDRTEALRDLIIVYELSEAYPAALEAIQQLEQREPLTAGEWFVRAVCYDKLRRNAEALAAYRKFVSLDQGRSAKQDFQARQRIRILTRELERNH